MNTKAIATGALTALITPFDEKTKKINWAGVYKLIEFQVSQGISGIVPVGTTGESPTLSEREHMDLISNAILSSKGLYVLSGCGSNSTREAMKYVDCVAGNKGDAVLLVDPYYIGPSSLEIREEYYAPIAKAFPNISIVPYIIPGRTGCQLQPEDLAVLASRFPNICAVKEATANFDNMRRTRTLAPLGFQIFSGDDGRTLPMMTDPAINACGVISVISNIAPAAVQEMCQALAKKDQIAAERIRIKLQPFFDIVTVSAIRQSVAGCVDDKFRNPLPIKTAMNILGMPAGPCRQPLGKMSVDGGKIVHKALETVWTKNPEILFPIQEHFGSDIEWRLLNNSLWRSFCY